MVGTTGGSNGNGHSGKTAPNGQGSSASASAKKQLLVVQYPVNSVWEFTLQPNQDTILGRVYCTDETSQIIVLQKALVHTTLACEIHMVNVASIVQAKSLPDSEETQQVAPLSQPLPKTQKKALEERERKAIRLAEDSFKHINQKATPEGQAVFDRLLKACSVVVWKEESIVVLSQIQVDPPYSSENCKIVRKGSNNALEDGSLDRVKKIVAASSATYIASP